MSQNSKIEWTHHTYNPWEGCAKVSPGCANCYAEARNKRLHAGSNWGHGAPRRRMSRKYRLQAFKWNQEAEKSSQSTRVFCGSLMDWLDPEVDIQWLCQLLETVKRTPHLQWLLLTKRPEIWWERTYEAMQFMAGTPVYAEWLSAWRGNPTNGYKADPPKNVWIGVTMEDQERAHERLEDLISIPALTRFISVEPMIGKVDLDLEGIVHEWEGGYTTVAQYIHWVICGGESGHKARPFNPDWARDLLRQCRATRTPFFMKQMGRSISSDDPPDVWPPNTTFRSNGPILRHPKGGDPSEWPEELRVREVPTKNR